MIRGAFPPITTRQAFRDALEIFSTLDDTYFDLTGAKVQVSIASQWPFPWWGGNDYGIAEDIGSYPAPRLTCSTADGTITNPVIGVYIFNFTPAQIATLCPGQYMVGADISRGDFRVTLLLGDLLVLDGVTPQ